MCLIVAHSEGATATANPADLQAQITLLQQNLTELNEAVLLLSAPKGIALTSGEHLQLSASDNLIATARKHADVSVAKNFFIGVGNTLSIFVRKLGMKLIANQGPITVQAQNDLMELLARKAITITSTEDEIKITAKKKITLNAGGSYITLDANKIESGTAGEYLTKAGNYGRLDKASLKSAMPAFPVIEPGEQSLRFALSEDAVGQPYMIHNSMGELVAKGMVSEDGRTSRIKLNEPDELKLSLGDTKWKVEPIEIKPEQPGADLTDLPLHEELYDDPYLDKLDEDDSNNSFPSALLAKIVGNVEGSVKTLRSMIINRRDKG